MKHNCGNSSFLFLSAFTMFFVVAVDFADAQRNRGGRGGRGGGSGWKFVAEKYDANKDGKVTAKEYTRGEEAFKSLDTDSDGVLNEKDWSTRTRNRGGSGDAPEMGDTAPDFSLTEIRNADNTITLSDFAGKQPVALIFGSCT